MTFAPLTLPDPVNAYRSGSGAPGPSYWQNGADYEMHADLDTAAKQLKNAEIVTYTNNSPDTLTSLWVQLDQNTYRTDARSKWTGSGTGRGRGASPESTSTDGFVLDSVDIEAGKKVTKATYIVSDTRMQIRLAEPLKPHGGQLKIHINYHYQIPGTWGGRTSWGTSEKGDIYDIAQWYPRMAVYDDLRGWDTLPYIGSEFYLEYGDFDYYITAPSAMLIAGCGELMNASDVLTRTQIDRLAQARASDKTVYIRTPAEVTEPSSRPKQRGTLTWHFHMDNTRDVAWSASSAFVWDAARINLPDGKKSLAMSVYPLESVGADAWDRSTEYVKDTVERFSRQWFPFPWPAAISVAGFSSGMEYPGMVFDGITSKRRELFLAHRARDWPQLVSDDRRVERTPQRVHGRGLQHVHRYRRVGRVRGREVRSQARLGVLRRR